jgi:glycerol-3-phosphate dehydrogenase
LVQELPLIFREREVLWLVVQRLTSTDIARRLSSEVGLVEQGDLASGTSSRSSKLVHGGLRYLAMFDFGLVREALAERGLLMTRLAPHLVRPVPFLYPLRGGLERAYVGAGLVLYDTLATLGKQRMGVPRHRHLSRRSVLRDAPGLRADRVTGAVRYYDCQVDDARLAVTIARTAAGLGALVATRARMTGFLRDGERVVGVRVRDLESGSSLQVHARAVVNATGVWTQEVASLLDAPAPIAVRASKGIHLVVPRDRIASDSALVVRTGESVLFVIPWRRHWIIGTTDTPHDDDLSRPVASRDDVEYLLREVNDLLEVPLDRSDVDGVYAGLRPLALGTRDRRSWRINRRGTGTSTVSREHTVVSPAPGLVVVAGGKLTTYRLMARDAVDLAVRGRHVGPSRTENVPLLGADGFHARSSERNDLARRSGLDQSHVDHLLDRYGGLVEELVELVATRPELAAAVPGAEDYLAAEIVHAVTHEGALQLDDVLVRRTHISMEAPDGGAVASAAVADLMAAHLGWSRDRRDREVSEYLEVLVSDRQGLAKVGDHA